MKRDPKRLKQNKCPKCKIPMGWHKFKEKQEIGSGFLECETCGHRKVTASPEWYYQDFIYPKKSEMPAIFREFLEKSKRNEELRRNRELFYRT